MEIRFRLSLHGTGHTLEACWDNAITTLLMQTPGRPMTRKTTRSIPQSNAYAVIWHGDDADEAVPNIPEPRRRRRG